jgi:hypothetical protein
MLGQSYAVTDPKSDWTSTRTSLGTAPGYHPELYYIHALKVEFAALWLFLMHGDMGSDIRVIGCQAPSN